MLAKGGLDLNNGDAGFAPWLQHELGGKADVADIVAYFDRKVVDGSQVLYRQGDPADTIDLVAAGNLAIDIEKADGSSLRVRRTRRSGAATALLAANRTFCPPCSVSDISPPLVVDGISTAPLVLNTMFENVLLSIYFTTERRGL